MTLGTWKYLQDNDYFKKHRLYNSFKVEKPADMEIEDVKNKTVLDLGCGFGRNSAWFSVYAKKVYAIDVSCKVLKEAFDFIYANGKYDKVQFYLPDNYKDYVKNLDYAFCRFVFQHITKSQAKNYIDFIYENLNAGGKINFQFRLGTQSKVQKNIEPNVEYTEEELYKLLEHFKFNNTFYHNNHLYILGTKK